MEITERFDVLFFFLLLIILYQIKKSMSYKNYKIKRILMLFFIFNNKIEILNPNVLFREQK